MENAFAQFVERTGLTDASAVAYLGVGERVVLRWRTDHGVASETCMKQLELLHAEQVRMAAEIVQQWESDGGTRRLVLEASRSDEEAMARGWPSLAAETTVARLVQISVASLDMKIIERPAKTSRSDADQKVFNLFDDFDS